MRDEVDRLHFPRRAGRGAPMAMLHGQAASSQYWRPALEALSGDNDVAVVDLLGFGDSPRPLSYKYSLDDHVRLLHHTLITRFSRKPMHLVGQAMGSLVALGYAAKYPDDVAELTLFDTPILLDAGQRARFPGADVGATSAAEIEKTLAAVRDRVNKTLDKDITSQLGGDEYERRAGTALRSIEEIVAGQDVPALLDMVTAPVKLVYGAEDHGVVPEFQEVLAKAYDNVTAVKLPGEGNLPVTQPAAALAEIQLGLAETVVDEAVKATKSNKWWIGGASAVQLLRSADLALAVRGLIMLVAGIAIIVITGIPIHTIPIRLLSLFAAGYVLFESAQTIIGAIGLANARKAWLTFGLIGLVGLVAGLYLLINPQIGLGLLLLVLAIRALFTGVFDLVVAYKVGGGPTSKGWLVLQGLAQIAFALIVFFSAGHGVRLLVYVLEGYLIFSGVSLVAFAWQSRRVSRRAVKPKLRAKAA
jgi:pimeloyl-ACP methyl ester carboxylesterase/uncharacterized membrane protein HdeD (DUF308 family)